MKDILVALAQVNPTVGDLEGNAAIILDRAREAASAGAQWVVFPELALCGYPPEDLVLTRHFLEDSAVVLRRLARALPAHVVTLLGAPFAGRSGAVWNAAICLCHGRRQAVYRKRHLPNYGVFDEKRLFRAGRGGLLLEGHGLRAAVHICEDAWAATKREWAVLRRAAPDVLINLSASPYHRGKDAERLEVLRHAALAARTRVAYCNLVGGQDELVFDGGSLLLDARGRRIARAERFEQDILLCAFRPRPGGDRSGSVSGLRYRMLQTPPGPRPVRRALPPSRPVNTYEGAGEVYRALMLGLRDYAGKNGFQRALVSISGGIDSALVAALAVDAIGAANVETVTLPSAYTSAGTLRDARSQAKRMRTTLHVLSIQPLLETYLEQMRALWEQPPSIAIENLQARIRGTIVMALSNAAGLLVLATGNKSELAMGYCTLYGDMAGGYAVLKDVPKTMVYELARWRNARQRVGPIPAGVLARPPSAELRPGQRDSDSLPPYEVLDAILELYVEQGRGLVDIVTRGFDPATVRAVVRAVDQNEYKRRQAPPGIKITPRAFGRERRFPVTNRYWKS